LRRDAANSRGISIQVCLAAILANRNKEAREKQARSKLREIRNLKKIPTQEGRFEIARLRASASESEIASVGQSRRVFAALNSGYAAAGLIGTGRARTLIFQPVSSLDYQKDPSACRVTFSRGFPALRTSTSAVPVDEDKKDTGYPRDLEEVSEDSQKHGLLSIPSQRRKGIAFATNGTSILARAWPRESNFCQIFARAEFKFRPPPIL